ncbi:MAG: MopE-related protein [Myxococcota bacterium]
MTRPSIALVLVSSALHACGPRYPRDFDGDGYYSHQDCNDHDASVNVMAQEIPFDGVDNDCNGATLDDDGDQDGISATDDCDDTDPRVPAPEVYYDGIDNDCDPFTADDDQDGDGFTVGSDCDDTDARVSPGNVEVLSDGLDNDCNPLTLDGDTDGDGLDAADDCDDLDSQVGGPTTWYVDCDGDGFAGELAPSVASCDLPPVDASCTHVLATWTAIEPADAPYGVTNTTTDCNDRLTLAFPGQVDFFDLPAFDAPQGREWDYDCSGATEPLYPLFQCVVNPIGPGCVAFAGFDSLTQCGQAGDYVEECEGDIPCSAADPVGVEVQQCH